MNTIPVTVNDRWTLRMLPHRAQQWEHRWEEARLDAMHDVITARSAPVVVDVGAEEGDMPALFAAWGADVILVEPGHRVWANIRATFEANDLRSPLASFVGFCDSTVRETLTGYPYGAYAGWPTCSDRRVVDDHGFANVDERPDIPATTVDDLCCSARVDVLTIDVEGAEFRVLCGARQTMERDAPVVFVSVHKDLRWMEEKYAGQGRDAVVSYMKSIGYEGTQLSDEHEEHWRFDRA